MLWKRLQLSDTQTAHVPMSVWRRRRRKRIFYLLEEIAKGWVTTILLKMK